ncbi:DUF3772 domain-containing protein [Breoghania sp.]|uniref:DUF3772 domain-containing protein n=1 Tax=Breoghania sp. TaxID=2065378 RepID=UPI0029C9D95F|nr:DUF3772 domain-containing protein [Breoghania sp.]
MDPTVTPLLRLFAILFCLVLTPGFGATWAQDTSQLPQLLQSGGADAAAEKTASGDEGGADTAKPEAAAKEPAVAAEPVQLDPTLQATLDTNQRKIDMWGRQLDQAEADLQLATIDPNRLDNLRSSIVDMRTASEEVRSTLRPRADAVERRVQELQPVEGAQEAVSAAVAAQLEEQRAQLSAINGLLKQVQVIQLRADEVLTRIVQYRRDQLTRRLFTPTPSVLDPNFWSRVVEDLGPLISSAGRLVSNWFRAIYAISGAWAVMLVVMALVGTYGLIWPLRRLLLDRAARDPDVTPAPMHRSTAALAITILATVVPAAAMVILFRGLEAFNLAPDQVGRVLGAIFRGAVFASFVQGLAWALIAPSRPNWRLLPISDDAAGRLMQLATAAGITFAMSLIFNDVLDVLTAPVDLILALQSVIAIILGFIIIAALKAIAGSGQAEAETIDGGGLSPIARWLMPVFWLGALITLFAPVIGYMQVSSFVAQQIIWSVSVFGITHLLLVVVDDVALAMFRADSRLGRALRETLAFGPGTIEQIGVLLSGVLRILLIVGAVISLLAPWGFSTGDVTSLVRQVIFGFEIGSFHFSLSEVVLALVIFVVGLTVTRALQRWLEMSYLPHTRLDVGLKSSIRTGVGYVGVIVAGMIAFTFMGLSLQNVAIVAGALSVGIGFGLQSIVNNFVSGLILLAERPIKVGDWIVVGEAQGYVRRINVRATEIETFDRQTVIVPNSDLISGVVKNWMHDDTSGRIILGVGVSYDTDPELVRDILMEVARENSQLLAYPAPVVYFMEFGASSLDFELRAYLAQIDYALSVKSDMRFEIMRRFRDAGIEIPFPQRDLNIRDMDRLEAALRGREETSRNLQPTTTASEPTHTGPHEPSPPVAEAPGEADADGDNV